MKLLRIKGAEIKSGNLKYVPVCRNTRTFEAKNKG